MPIDASCPGCQATLRIGDEFAGQQARCPRCDTVYQVPLHNEVTAAVVIEPPPPAETIASPPETAPPLSAPLPEPTSPPPPTAHAELPPAVGTQWFLRTPEGQVFGPTTSEHFDRWVREGRVTPDCFVSAGDNVWRPAGELFPELAAPRPKTQLRPETLSALRKQPHRGALVLLLGIMGVITTCPIPSVMAWVMGSYDLGEMQMGRMDDAGQGTTATGRMLGMIFSMVYVCVAVIGMFVLVLITARG
jgi:hypothetical protein